MKAVGAIVVPGFKAFKTARKPKVDYLTQMFLSLQ